MTGARFLVVGEEGGRRRASLFQRLAPIEYEVVLAANAAEAMAHLRAAEADMLLVDITVRDIDLLELVSAVRAVRDIAWIPVLVLTPARSRVSRLAALEAGADEVLDEPLDAAVLRSRMASLLRLKRAVDGADCANRQLVRAHRNDCFRLGQVAAELAGLGPTLLAAAEGDATALRGVAVHAGRQLASLAEELRRDADAAEVR